MSDNHSQTVDQERVVRTLTRIARRLRQARVTRELFYGFTWSLILPVSVSVIYRFVAMSWMAVAVLSGLWLLGVAVYGVTTILRKGTLLGAAEAVDRQADLHDELTTAYWFHREGRSSSWINLQLHRAAVTADDLNVDQLYAWSMPRRARTTAGLLALLLVLNLLPLSWTRSWLEAGPPPVVAFTDADQMLLTEVERMLAEVAALQDAELPPEMREALAELQQGMLTREQALAELEKLETMLDMLDSTELNHLMNSMAEALTSTNAESLIDALSDRDLDRAAEALRNLSTEMSDAEREQLQAVLEQIAEQAENEFEELAEKLADAAEQLAKGDEEQARQAMERLAQELEQLAQQQQGQEIREAAAQGLEQLQQALSDDSNQLQAATDEMASGDQAAAGMPQPGTQDPDALSMQAAEAGAQSAEQGQGDLSVPGAGDEIEYGAPTTLEVELLPESMELAPQSGDEPGEQLIDQPSQAEESKLEYQPVESDVTYGEADLLKANTIPLSYRALIKRYFQAVGPRGQHDY
jgi:hypothetical protein